MLNSSESRWLHFLCDEEEDSHTRDSAAKTADPRFQFSLSLAVLALALFGVSFSPETICAQTDHGVPSAMRTAETPELPPRLRASVSKVEDTLDDLISRPEYQLGAMEDSPGAAALKKSETALGMIANQLRDRIWTPLESAPL